MTTGAISIDIQLDYFEGGAMPLPGADLAVRRAAVVVAACRSAGTPVIHLQHLWDEPEATFMRPGTPGIEIHPDVAPVTGETVLVKRLPNGFVGTTLDQQLRDAGVTDLLIFGMMSNMCVDGTARAASDLGFGVTVVHDACAAADLEFGGTEVAAEQVHAAFMAGLAEAYALVVGSEEAVSSLR